MKKLKKIKKIVKNASLKSIPLWAAVFLTFESWIFIGLLEYFVIKKTVGIDLIELSNTTKSQDDFALLLKQEVIPQKGYILTAEWKDIGKKLVEEGAIDEDKYKDLFADEQISTKHMWHLNNSSNDKMTINEGGGRFMVNTLWALGLINKSPILDNGPLKENSSGDIMTYASTGGWGLGTKQTSILYSSKDILNLTEKQQKLVEKIAKNVYRPCCDNSVYFPDCNHGMAALGYIELAVKQGVSEEKIYKDLLALNSYWFPQSYVDIAAYFYKNGTSWDKVDPKKALSKEYSSGSGSQFISSQVQDLELNGTSGGGCSA